MGMVGDMRISLTPANNVEFIDFFAPHHSMAVEIADAVLERGENIEVRAMAQQMRDAQTSEIATMASIRQSLTGDRASPTSPVDPHMQTDMQRMTSMNGRSLDQMFLREMISHHAAAIPTAHRAKPHVQNSELRAMTDDIFDTQSREVGVMQHMLETL